MTDDPIVEFGHEATCRGHWGSAPWGGPTGDVQLWTCLTCRALTADPRGHRDWHVVAAMGR